MKDELSCYVHCLVESARWAQKGEYILVARYLDHAFRSLKALNEMEREEHVDEQDRLNHHRRTKWYGFYEG